MYGRIFVGHFVIATIAFLDQYLKSWVLGRASSGQGLLGVMHVVPNWNRGVAFGLFNWLDYSNNLFLVVASVMCVFLYQIFLGAKIYQRALGYAMVLGGAIGNIIDRIVHCAVLDFIDVSFNGRHFPSFNLADLAITLGVLILLTNFLTSMKRN
jgi:signal peptidase II